jgi:hypothetical protein
MNIFTVNCTDADDFSRCRSTPIKFFSTKEKAEDYNNRIQLLYEGQYQSWDYFVSEVELDASSEFDSMPLGTILYNVSLFKNGDLEEVNTSSLERYSPDGQFYSPKVEIFKPKDKKFSRKRTLKDRAEVFLFACGKEDAVRKAKALREELVEKNQWKNVFLNDPS